MLARWAKRALAMTTQGFVPTAPTAHHSSAQGNALGFRPSQTRAPTVRDTVVRRNTSPRIAALQAADLSTSPTQGAALG